MGVPWKYGQLGIDNSLALKKFKGALARTRAGKSPSFGFEVNLSGFELFLSEVGCIPEEMTRPSLGRKDHSKGYELGNIFWQELSDNCRENGFRSGQRAGKSRASKKLSQETKMRISESMKRRFSQGAS